MFLCIHMQRERTQEREEREQWTVDARGTQRKGRRLESKPHSSLA